MKILNTYSLKLAMIVLLLLGLTQHSEAADPLNLIRVDNYGLTVSLGFMTNNLDPTTIDELRVYEAEGYTNDINNFKQIRSYDFSNYPNIDSSVRWTGQLNTITTYKQNNFPYDKAMSYYISCVIGNIESDIPDSTYYFYIKGPKDSINFTIWPPNLTTIALGFIVNFNANAISSMGNTLHYKLVDSPNNDAKIDKLTGELELVPTEVGDFTYTIRAYDKDDEDNNYADQKLNTRVYNCMTTINGVVTINNEPPNLIRGSVDIYKITKDSTIHEKSAPVLNNGKFQALVDEGKYIIRFNGFVENQQLVEWYDAKEGMDEADEVETVCNETTDISWNIEHKNTLGYRIDMEQLTDYPYSFIPKGGKFEEKIEFTTNPKGEEVEFTLSSDEHFTLTGPNKDILKLNATEPGFYNVGITARMKEYKNVSTNQIVRVWITECDDINELTINLIDKETGKNITGYITANLYRLDSNDRDSLYYSWTVDSTATQDGKFVFNVDKGNYFFEAFVGVMVDGKFTYYRYIYNFDEPTNNNSNIENSEIIEIDCDNQTLNLEIRAPKEVKSYTISGYAKDEDSNEAIEYAQIEVVGKNKLTDDISRKYAYTNDNGYYTIRVLDNEVYTVSAHSAYDSIDINPYLREFWEETANPLEATVIDLTGNLENINFTLEERSEYKNTLNGIVLNEDDEGIEGASVVVYLIEPTAFDVDLKYWATSGYTDSKGEFEFENLIPGKYIVYSSTNKRDHIPGYYESDDETLTKSWLDATRIEVEETGSFGDLELRLAPLKPIASNKGLSGKVGRLKGVSPGSSAILNPLNGVQVFVTNSDDKVINYNYSEKDGEYEVPNLENGELNIYFDKVGFRMAHEQIIITDNNENIELDVEMEGLSTSDVTPFEDVNASLYPNPSTGNVTITGDFNFGSYLVKVISMTGSTVKIIPVEISAASVSLDLSALYSGQYYIQLIGNNANYSTKVKIIK